jgi:hypothetical protein
MRLKNLPVLLLLVVATSFAQDTNFPTGPQYLITTGNPMLLGPIATPSLNLSGETLAGTSEVPRPIEMPALAPVETFVYLHNVYWGERTPEEALAVRLQPPNMAPDQTAWYMDYVATQAAGGFPPPYAETDESVPTSEFTAGANLIELTGGPVPANLPASLFEPGVTGVTNAESLQQRGYGVSLGEVAAYWKAHKRQASHVIRDEDLRQKQR